MNFNKVTFIGDVHGKYPLLEKILNAQENRDHIHIQVGDLGIGFFGRNDPFLDIKPPNFRFIRGNHDNPQMAKSHIRYLGDYGITDNGIFYVSGADSVDKHMRTEGVDWWREEELAYSCLQEAISIYYNTRPNIVVSHTCPGEILEHLHSVYSVCRTESALNTMLDIHIPKLWVFGHHHKAFDKTIKGCRFVCLPELKTFTYYL